MFADDSGDLVVALGVLHQAGTRSEWERAVREVVRVTSVGGLLLHAAWSPGTHPEGVPLEPVPGDANVFVGFHSGRHYLLDQASHDEAMATHGFVPVAPTEEVRVETERGERVTINGLYRHVLI